MLLTFLRGQRGARGRPAANRRLAGQVRNGEPPRGELIFGSHFRQFRTDWHVRPEWGCSTSRAHYTLGVLARARLSPTSLIVGSNPSAYCRIARQRHRLYHTRRPK